MKTLSDEDRAWAPSARRLLQNVGVSEASVAMAAGRTPPWVNQYLSRSRPNPTLGTVSEINNAIALAIGGVDRGQVRRVLDYLTSLAAAEREGGESLRDVDMEDAFAALMRFQLDYLRSNAVESIWDTILGLPTKVRKPVIAALSAFKQRARLKDIVFDESIQLSPFQELQKIFDSRAFERAGLSLDAAIRDDEHYLERLRLDEFERVLRSILVRITTCDKCGDEATNAQRHFAHNEIQKGMRAIRDSRYK